MSLNANALAEVSEVKTYLQITDTDSDTLLEALVNYVSQLIELRCDRKFIKTTFIEIRDAYDTDTMWLNESPILTSADEGTIVNPVLEIDYDKDDTWEAATEYNWTLQYEKSTGKVWLNEGNRFVKGTRVLRFTYTAGYLNRAAVPFDLKWAAIKLVATLKTQIATKGFGLASVAIMGESTSYNFDKIPDDVDKVLQRYRRRRVV